MKTQPSEKLQKVLASAGLGSRRALEGWIQLGRVSVNGKRAELGARVSPSDVIRVDGRFIACPNSGKDAKPFKTRVLRYHKPVGEICSRADPEKRKSVFAALPNISMGRWISVGRLDINTSGILIFTNSGELAHRLMHPANELEREYAVRVLPWFPAREESQVTTQKYKKHPASPSPATSPYRSSNKPKAIAAKTPEEAILQLQKGIVLEDGLARFERIKDAGGQGQNHWYHVVLKEGKNHEVRRLWEAAGFHVSRLIRLRFGPIALERQLRPGRWEELTEKEVAELTACVGLENKSVNRKSEGKRRSEGKTRRSAPGPRSRSV